MTLLDPRDFKGHSDKASAGTALAFGAQFARRAVRRDKRPSQNPPSCCCRARICLLAGGFEATPADADGAKLAAVSSPAKPGICGTSLDTDSGATAHRTPEGG